MPTTNKTTGLIERLEAANAARWEAIRERHRANHAAMLEARKGESTPPVDSDFELNPPAPKSWNGE